MTAGPVRDWDPEAYERWFKTPLGRMVDIDEKSVFFGLANLKRGERVLDIGCGAGHYTIPAAERTGMADGIDPSEPMLRAAWHRRHEQEGTAYVQGVGEALPFAEATFDVVLIVTVLCFLTNLRDLLDEAYRVLRPGGRIVIGDLGRYSSWAFRRRIQGWLGNETWRQAHFQSPKGLRNRLSAVGFENPVVRGAVFYPPIDNPFFLRPLHRLETLGRRLCPWTGAFLVASGSKKELASSMR